MVKITAVKSAKIIRKRVLRVDRVKRFLQEGGGGEFMRSIAISS